MQGKKDRKITWGPNEKKMKVLNRHKKNFNAQNNKENQIDMENAGNMDKKLKYKRKLSILETIKK